MGYYSDVALCLSPNALEAFEQQLEAIRNSDIRQEVNCLLDCRKLIFSDTDSGSQLWYWDYIKWYPDDADIAFMDNFLNELPSAEYRFMRIGENYDDVQVDGEFNDNPFELSIDRKITFENTGVKI